MEVAVFGNGTSLQEKLIDAINIAKNVDHLCLCNKAYEFAILFSNVKYIGICDRIELERILRIYELPSEYPNKKYFDEAIFPKLILHQTCEGLINPECFFNSSDRTNTGLHLIRQCVYEEYDKIHCIGFDSIEKDLWIDYPNKDAALFRKDMDTYLSSLPQDTRDKIIFY